MRLCAEDPDNNFFPTGGTIQRVGYPKLPNCRWDAGYRDGNTVTTDFDPLLGKLIAWGPARQDAIASLFLSLDDIPFLGLTTNRDYLKRILAHPQFLDGRVSTAFVENYKEELIPIKLSSRQQALAAAAFLLSQNNKSTGKTTCWDDLTGFRNV